MVDRLKVTTDKGEVDYDKRESGSHVTEEQYWVYGSTPPVSMWFAHKGRHGDANNFFFKHFLLPSKKTTTSENKMANRLAHRNAPNKGTGKQSGGMSWLDKYAKLAPEDNTVIDLNIISAKETAEKFVKAISDPTCWNKAGAWNKEGRNNRVKIVTVDFGKACVRQVKQPGAANSCKVAVRKVGDDTYDVYHMEH